VQKGFLVSAESVEKTEPEWVEIDVNRVRVENV
jgi:hypothetical protein